MSLVLVADIGGSKSRYALAEPGGRPRDVGRFDNDSVGGVEDAIGRYLTDTGAKPDVAVLSLASLIEGRDFALTNRPDWRIDLDAISRRFGIARVEALNDFEAIALALPRLTADDLRVLGPPIAPRHGPKVALGPGTGLGTATLIPRGNDWQVLPGEGGHAALGPRTAEEFPVFARLRAREGAVSVETVLSGRGLVRLAHAIDPASKATTPEGIITDAKAGEAQASAVAREFVRLLGRVAGDLALFLRAAGGVYISGGLGRGLGNLLEQDAFRDGFEDHPPYEAWLRGVPTWLVTYREPGLLGCVVEAERLLR